MESLKKFLKSLIFIFMPHYWFMNEQYSHEWDLKLNKLLDTFEFTQANRHMALLGNELIWIANYPYACFTPCSDYNWVCNFRASRLTILKAKKSLGILPKIDPYSNHVKELTN